MRAIIILSLAIFLTGCLCEGPATSKRTGKKYYPVKVCTIGDMDGSTCVEYAAEKYDPKGPDLMIWTIDGHAYRFNHAGWAWIVTIR